MIKPWIIYVSHSVCVEDVYGAYSDGNPVDKFPPELWTELADSNFNSFSFHDGGPDPESYETEEEYEEAYDEWYQEYIEEVDIHAELDEYDEINEYQIIYDERDI